MASLSEVLHKVAAQVWEMENRVRFLESEVDTKQKAIEQLRSLIMTLTESDGVAQAADSITGAIALPEGKGE